MRKSFVLIILAAGVLAGCGSGGGSAKLSADDVAVVGSEHVSLTDLNTLLARAKTAYKQQGQAFPKHSIGLCISCAASSGDCRSR